MHLPPLEVGILKPMKRPVLPEEPKEEKKDAERKNSRPVDRRVCKLLIEELRRMIADVADTLCLDVDIREYPVSYDAQKRLVLKNFASAEEICEKDMTVIVDPQDNGLSFAAGSGRKTMNPLRRVLAAFSDKHDFEDRFDILGTLKLPLATSDDESEIDLLTRGFGLHIPPNVDDAARLYQQNLHVVAKAMTYPYGQTLRENRKKYFDLSQ